MTKKKLIIICSLLIMIIACVGLSYAYIDFDDELLGTVDTTTGLYTMEFKDGNALSLENIQAGSMITKSFSIKNTSDKQINVNITFDDVINELAYPDDMVYLIVNMQFFSSIYAYAQTDIDTILELLIPDIYEYDMYKTIGDDEEDIEYYENILEGMQEEADNYGILHHSFPTEKLITDFSYVLAPGEENEFLVCLVYKNANHEQDIDMGKTVSAVITATATPAEEFMCKRAKTLHSVICENEYFCSISDYSDEILTFGTLGTPGTYNIGDAYDCDVNGDGTYDPDAERFYYMNYYNNLAMLVYSNTYGSRTKYSNTSSIYDGPQAAMQQLPTKEEWPNVYHESILDTITFYKKNYYSYRVDQKVPFTYSTTYTRLLNVGMIPEECRFNVFDCPYLLESGERYFLENGLEVSYDGEIYNISENDEIYVRPIITIPIERLEK